jgi:alginate O-acetyltransferase complex protein AlgI
MLFTSIPFVILVLITMVFYYLPPIRSWQVWVLTAASFAFYSWEAPLLVILLVASILINVVTSYQVAKGKPEMRKFWALAGVGLNLGLLFFFKYGIVWRRSWIDWPLPRDHPTAYRNFILHFPGD